jgi:hypothetical protein
MISTKKDRIPMSTSNFMRPPIAESGFQVGDAVEVYCDHDKGGTRIRGWLKGIVVQVDYKMVAVQFRTNVFLTDGWMVPDHILWFTVHSEHIRFPLHKSSKVALPRPF